MTDWNSLKYLLSNPLPLGLARIISWLSELSGKTYCLMKSRFETSFVSLDMNQPRHQCNY